MAALNALLTRTRMELADVKRPVYEVLTSSGVSRLDLQAEHLESLYIYPQDDPGNLIAESDYSVDKAAGRVFFDPVRAYGEVLVFEGESSKLFSDEEFMVFVESAFSKHTHNRNPAVNFANLPPVEEHLVSILAKIEALWVLLTSAAYDINIHAPEGMFVPRAQRYQQLRELLALTEAQYKELSNALGVGLYTLEMLTLRRVSRLTGRYVPIYLDREIDDTRPPQRVFPEISSQGAELPEPNIVKENIQVTHDRPFTKIFEFTEDDLPLVLDSARDTFDVRILRSPFTTYPTRDVLPEFTVVVNAPATHEVTISLTSEQTSLLHSTGSYQWTFSWKRDGDEVYRAEGELLVESGLPLKSVNVRLA